MFQAEAERGSAITVITTRNASILIYSIGSLIVVGATKIYGEASGSNTLEGRAKATDDEIAQQLKIRFRDRGWIS